MLSLICWSLIALGATPQSGVGEADLAWLSGHRQAIFDALMPLEPTGLSVAYRSYRDLYYDVPEQYFVIRVQLSPDTFEADIVQPIGRSIQEQALALHLQDRDATVESVVGRIEVQRLRLSAESCPAIERRVRVLQESLFPMPDLGTIVIHPVLHRVVIQFAAGDADLRLSSDADPVAQWAVQTLSALRRCVDVTSSRGMPPSNKALHQSKRWD